MTKTEEIKKYTLKEINKALYYNDFFGTYFKTPEEVNKFMDILVDALEYYQEIGQFLRNDNNAEHQ